MTSKTGIIVGRKCSIPCVTFAALPGRQEHYIIQLCFERRHFGRKEIACFIVLQTGSVVVEGTLHVTSSRSVPMALTCCVLLGVWEPHFKLKTRL